MILFVGYRGIQRRIVQLGDVYPRVRIYVHERVAEVWYCDCTVGYCCVGKCAKCCNTLVEPCDLDQRTDPVAMN